MSIDFSSNPRIDPRARRVTASIFDRLVLIDADGQRELEQYDAKSLRADVRRSLEAILNTRRPMGKLPPELSLLADSIYLFGIPDITDIAFGAPDQMRAVCQRVEMAISRFEPRLLNVRVELQGQETFQRDRVLRFRIRAKLQARPRPQEVVYDSVVKPNTNEFEVWVS